MSRLGTQVEYVRRKKGERSRYIGTYIYVGISRGIYTIISLSKNEQQDYKNYAPRCSRIYIYGSLKRSTHAESNLQKKKKRGMYILYSHPFLLFLLDERHGKR